MELFLEKQFFEKDIQEDFYLGLQAFFLRYWLFPSIAGQYGVTGLICQPLG